MQSTPTRPSHHANASRSLFQNPWPGMTVDPNPDSTLPPPPLPPPENHDSDSDTSPTPTDGTMAPASPSTAGLALPISIERVRALDPRPPHPPIKVIKPDWGRRSSTAASLKATWLGHASFLVEFPSRTVADELPRVLFDPIFSDSAGPSPWVGVQRRLPPPCTVAELPEFQFVVYSHNHYDHLDLPTLQQIHELRGDRVHFLVPLGNKTWFEETGIPTSQITELDWWDIATLPTHPHSHQELKFVCTPAQHTSEIGSKYGPFDIAMLPIWRGGSFSFVARLGFRVVHTRESILTSWHATPAHALRMHLALRARHSLAMHFATFAGSDVEALDPIVELEQAKREMMMMPPTSAAVGDWWMEGGMGVIDVGETATVHVGETEASGLENEL
ncbi:Metallo-hydrolase/oxidoreductase [Lactarius akahatsu]|uniref:Metallo-hydrolase/oxidoreductase n=1 Tax=Lactarius akahatsu TaxID=416441 RepID=A0AAD4L2N9_9AGAM|nr:Metallo-hydrolase/oxidoreductase [Lactarius akahatsu]